jgi:hypothetical protein
VRLSLTEAAISLLVNTLAWLLTLTFNDRVKSWWWVKKFMLFLALFGLTCLLLAARAHWIQKDETVKQIKDPLTTGFCNSSQDSAALRSWVVVLRDHNARAPSALTGAAVDALKEAGFTAVSAFGADIFRDPDYRHLYMADSALLRNMQRNCDGLIVGEITERSAPEPNPDLQGLITSRLDLTVRVFLTKSGALKSEFHISSRASGFSHEKAEERASTELGHEMKKRLATELR